MFSLTVSAVAGRPEFEALAAESLTDLVGKLVDLAYKWDRAIDLDKTAAYPWMDIFAEDKAAALEELDEEDELDEVYTIEWPAEPSAEVVAELAAHIYDIPVKHVLVQQVAEATDPATVFVGLQALGKSRSDVASEFDINTRTVARIFRPTAKVPQFITEAISDDLDEASDLAREIIDEAVTDSFGRIFIPVYMTAAQAEAIYSGASWPAYRAALVMAYGYGQVAGKHLVFFAA